jgi:hypothetical protein
LGDLEGRECRAAVFFEAAARRTFPEAFFLEVLVFDAMLAPFYAL